jgi:hypothetical protein
MSSVVCIPVDQTDLDILMSKGQISLCAADWDPLKKTLRWLTYLLFIKVLPWNTRLWRWEEVELRR